jgi:hypothetical protein
MTARMATLARRLPAASLVLLSALVACKSTVTVGSGPAVEGNGVARTETRTVPGFDALEVDAPMNVEVSPGPVSVTLTGDENLLPLVTTTVTGGKLVVRATKALTVHQPLALTVHVPSLARLESESLGKLHVTGIDVPRFVLAANGAAEVTLEGKADGLEVDANGVASVHASSLAAKDAKVSVTGTGSVEVAASGKLDATVTGMGGVFYRGTPAVAKTVTGLGFVKPLS